MKKIFIIFLFIIFSSSFSLAKNNEKITVEEIESIFFEEKKKSGATYEEKVDSLIADILLHKKFNSSSYLQPIPRDACSHIKYEEGKQREQFDCTIQNNSKGKLLSNRYYIKLLQYQAGGELKRSYLARKNDHSTDINSFIKKYSIGQYSPTKFLEKERNRVKYESYKKRVQTRGIAKCMYEAGYGAGWGTDDRDRQCAAKVTRVVFTRSEKAKKRRPGDIFYAFDAIEYLVYDKKKEAQFIKTVDRLVEDKPVPGMICSKPYYDNHIKCYFFKKSTLKKIEKFKKDPSNEKVLGHKLIKYIKNARMVNGIKEKLGTDNYALLGDMLNAVVVDVKKNNISPDLQKRRVLLKKYSLILLGIKKKLDEDNYKSIDKDVSKLSKTYKALKALTTTANEMVINIDEAVNIIFDTNKLVQISALNAKDNEEEKLLALSSIYFMQSLIDSILSIIPEKYFVETKELSQDLFLEDDLAELEDIINSMMKKNKEIKSAELTKSMNIINKYINPSDVVKTLDNLGMKNSISRTFTQDTAAKIVNQQIRDNLDAEILKEAKKIFQEIDKNELSDLAKEASDVAKEVSGVAKEVSDASESFSILDKKFGNFSLKQIIHASRNR